MHTYCAVLKAVHQAQTQSAVPVILFYSSHYSNAKLNQSKVRIVWDYARSLF